MQTKLTPEQQLIASTKLENAKLSTENIRLKKMFANLTVQLNQIVVKNRILQREKQVLLTENIALKRKMRSVE